MGWTSRAREAISSWWARSLRVVYAILSRLRDDALAREAVIGLVLVLVGVGAAVWIAGRQDQLARDLETASEIQENVRFVRQVSIDNPAVKPFRGLNLHGAALSGLDLSCKNIDLGTGCADLRDADLSDADLSDAKLTGAKLVFANLTGAFVAFANLTRANLGSADLAGALVVGADLTYAVLSGAELGGANLIGTDLTGARLDGTKLTGVCYTETTTWPDGFTPPPPDCGAWSADAS